MDNDTLIKIVGELNQKTYEGHGTIINPSLEALKLAQKHNNLPLIAQSQAGLGCYYANSGQPVSAIEHLIKAEAIYGSLPLEVQDSFWLGRLHCFFGIAYDDLGDYTKALWHHQQSLDIALKSDDGYGQQRGLMNIGYIYYRMGDGARSIELLGKATRHPKQARLMTAIAFEHLGDVYRYERHYELAKTSYLKATEFNNVKARLRQQIARTALCCIKLGELKEAEELLARAELFSLDEEPVFFVKAEFLLTKCELHAVMHNYDLAWGLCSEVLDLAVDAGNLQVQWEAKFHQGLILFKQGQLQQSVLLLNSLENDARIPFDLRYEIQTALVEIYSKTENWQQVTHTLKRLNEHVFVQQSSILTLYHFYEELEQSQMMKRVNERLNKKNSELEALRKEKENLFGIVAHDLKNPISAALMTMEVLKMVGDRMPEDKQQSRIKRTMAVMQQMKNIVSQLSTTAQLEAEQEEVDFEAICLDQLVENLVLQNAELASAKQQKLTIDHLPNAVVQGREIWLEQIFSNLISNAIKYSQIGGVVTVSLVVHKEAKRVSVVVQDDGQGLSQEDMRNMFIKYRKLSSVPTGDESSTGLGLYIVKRLVERMGGAVSADSSGKNLGSTFKVELPLSTKSV